MGLHSQPTYNAVLFSPATLQTDTGNIFVRKCFTSAQGKHFIPGVCSPCKILCRSEWRVSLCCRLSPAIYLRSNTLLPSVSASISGGGRRWWEYAETNSDPALPAAARHHHRAAQPAAHQTEDTRYVPGEDDETGVDCADCTAGGTTRVNFSADDSPRVCN